MSANIKKTDALQHVNYFRQELPPGHLKSVWFDRTLIDFILANADRLSGLRVYLARYKEGYFPTTIDPSLIDKDAIVIAATALEDGINKDQEDGYFDYSELCPTNCKGDSGE